MINISPINHLVSNLLSGAPYRELIFPSLKTALLSSLAMNTKHVPRKRRSQNGFAFNNLALCCWLTGSACRGFNRAREGKTPTGRHRARGKAFRRMPPLWQSMRLVKKLPLKQRTGSETGAD
jgi:hypothetical protein